MRTFEDTGGGGGWQGEGGSRIVADCYVRVVKVGFDTTLTR